MAGRVIASQFNWRVQAQVTAAAGATGRITVEPAWLTLPDGQAFEPWAVGLPVAVEDGAASETVVLTAADCTIGGPAPCTLQANFAQAHAGRLFLRSGSDGLQEAIDFLGSRGGTVVLTPDWSAPASVLAQASGSAPVQILDQRQGSEVWYAWNGSQYASTTAINSPAGAVTVRTMEQVRYADQFPGADIGAKVNAAYADCPAAGCTIRVPAGNYAFATPIVIGTVGKPAWIVGDGAGTVLTWTSNSGTALQFDPTQTSCCEHPHGLYGLRGLQLLGPNGTLNNCGYSAAVSAVGLRVGGPNEAEGFELDGVKIACFGTDVLLDSNVWGAEFHHFDFTDGSTAVLSVPSTSLQTGENIRFLDGVFANDWATPTLRCAVDINSAIGGDFTFIGDSFDGGQLCVESGDVTLIAPHFENPGNNLAVPFINNSASPGVTIYAGRFFQDFSPALPPAFIANSGSLDIHGLWAGSAASLPYFVTDSGTASTRITGNIGVGVAFANWINHTGTGNYWIDEGTGNFIYSGTPLFNHGMNLQGDYFYQSANVCGRNPNTGIIGAGGAAWAWNFGCGDGSTDFFSYKGSNRSGGFVFYGWDGTTANNLLAIDPQAGVTVAGTLNFTGNANGTAPGAAGGGSITTNFSAGQSEVNFWNNARLAQSTAPAFDWHVFDAGGTPHTLATLDRSGDLRLTGALASASLTVGSGPSLTSETGSGPGLVTSNSPTIASPIITGTPTLPVSYSVGSATVTQPATSGTLALTTQLPLAAVSAPLGGSSLSAGQCTSATVGVSGATVGMAVLVTPAADPGAGIVWQGWVSGAGIATVRLCNITSSPLTPASETYAVRALP